MARAISIGGSGASASIRAADLARATLPLILLLPGAALAAFTIIVWKYNGLYGQDPYAYYGYAVGPLRHTLLTGAAPTATFWPLGYPLPVALASLLLGPSPLSAQFVSLLAGLASVWLTYLLALELLSSVRTVAIIGALLVGLAGRTIEAETTAMADAVALCAILLSAYALLRWVGNRSTRQPATDEPSSLSIAGWKPSLGWAALTGGALGWAIVSRWGMLILVPLWAAAVLARLRTNRLRGLPPLFAACGAGAVVVGAQLLLVFTVTPARALGRWPFLGDLSLVQGGGWSPLNLLRHAFFTADGAQQYTLPNLAFYAAGVFHLQYLTPLWAPAVVLGAVAAWRLGSLPRLLLLAWPVVILLFAAGLPEQNARFILPALPSAAILAGLGLQEMWRYVPVAPRARFGIAATALLIVGAAGMHDVHRVTAERDGEVVVTTWASHAVPPGATVIAFEITGALTFTTDLRPYDLADITDGRLETLARSRPIYFLVRPASIAGQWRRRPPGIRMIRLARFPGLVTVGNVSGYTLYRTRSPGQPVSSSGQPVSSS